VVGSFAGKKQGKNPLQKIKKKRGGGGEGKGGGCFSRFLLGGLFGKISGADPKEKAPPGGAESGTENGGDLREKHWFFFGPAGKKKKKKKQKNRWGAVSNLKKFRTPNQPFKGGTTA